MQQIGFFQIGFILHVHLKSTQSKAFYAARLNEPEIKICHYPVNVVKLFIITDSSSNLVYKNVMCLDASRTKIVEFGVRCILISTLYEEFLMIKYQCSNVILQLHRLWLILPGLEHRILLSALIMQLGRKIFVAKHILPPRIKRVRAFEQIFCQGANVKKN